MYRLGKGNLRVPKLARPVYLIGCGLTDYRKAYPEKQSWELGMDAMRMAVKDHLKMDPRKFKEMVNFVIYSHFADHFSDQLLAAAKMHDYLGFEPLPNLEIKTGGATGGSAVLTAVMTVGSGMASVVPVVGWERMDEVSTRQGNAYIASAACKDFESPENWLYATYYALMMTRYLKENKIPREILARIAQKNHHYARFSPYTQMPGDYTLEEIINTKVVSAPLTFLECCQMSVGAACVIVADEDAIEEFEKENIKIQPVKVIGIHGGSDTLRTADRRPMDINEYLLPNETQETYKNRMVDYPGFTAFRAARFAAMKAYAMAGITDPVKDLDILETHDAFTVSDIQTYEDIGLRPYGRGAEFMESGEAYFEGALPTNLSGGLIGGMHSVGATGIFQIAEIVWQLQNRWTEFHADEKYWRKFGKTKPKDFKNLQVKGARRGAAISHAGTGSHVTMAILEEAWR